MGQSADYYAILGIERTADERAIKKAYFRLVRQFSPEAQPEAFKRIREAYEVLCNQAARREYDQVTQYGEEIGGPLRGGMEAMERGDLKTAQASFQHVLVLRPDLHVARDLLGMACLNNNQPREALKHFEELLSTAGDSAPYHLHKGYAHYALDQYDDAIAAYRRARELDTSDTRILVALADCYTAVDRYDEALCQLDLAIHDKGEVDFQDFVFFMRKVQIHLLRDRTDLAEQEIDRIFQAMPEDPEVRKYVAQKLSALSAQLFRIKRSADGNRLLRRAQHLGQRHGKSLELSFPVRATRKLADLPPASRKQILALAREPSPHKLTHGPWGGPLSLGLLALCVMGIPFMQAATSRTEWHGNTYALMAALLLLGPALLLTAAQRVGRVVRSQVGRFTTIHPLYLLQVDVDEVTAWPLVNLHDVSMTHHLQNGVYQYTAVRADFAGVPLMLTIRGQQTAVDWAQALLDARHRCLGLLSVGMLDEEEGCDILPPEMLQRPQDREAGWMDRVARRRLLWHYGGALVVGAGLLGGGTLLNMNIAEQVAWDHASTYPRAHSFRSYLIQYPRGRHAAEAQERLGRIYDEAQKRYLKQVGEAPGRQAMLDVLDALKGAQSQLVWVKYTAHVHMGSVLGQRLADGTLPIPPDRAFTDEMNQKREALITQRLAAALQEVLSLDVLSLTSYPGYHYRAASAPAVIFEVSYDVSPSGEIYRSTTDHGALQGIQLLWTLKIDTPRTRQHGGAPYAFKLRSQPAQSLRYLRRSEEDDEILPYTKMAESAFEEFGRKVADEFGVPAREAP